MLIDEYSDFESIVLKIAGKKRNLNTLESNSIQITKNKNLCESIELSNIVKIYFEPYLAKKFVWFRHLKN